MKSSKYPRLGAGYSQDEKKENWNLLKQSGVYEVEFFGDFVMHAIAKSSNKNILILNTSSLAADPSHTLVWVVGILVRPSACLTLTIMARGSYLFVGSHSSHSSYG